MAGPITAVSRADMNTPMNSTGIKRRGADPASDLESKEMTATPRVYRDVAAGWPQGAKAAI
jgi:hypothetical protein